jgi:hypothetical protein
MLATLGGSLALLLGLGILLLPLLATELSRPRDSFWGAVVLLLGLVLVTTTERLTGAPMLAVLCGGLLIGRLGSEVGLARWRQLTPEEQQRLGSAERWRSSLSQLGNSLAALVRELVASLSTLGGWIRERTTARATRTPQVTKRWVRPEPAEPPQAPELIALEDATAEPTTPEAVTTEAAIPEAVTPGATGPAPPPLAVVSSFEEVDVIVQQAIAAAQEPVPATETEHVEAEPNPEPESDREPLPPLESADPNPAVTATPEAP